MPESLVDAVMRATREWAENGSESTACPTAIDGLTLLRSDRERSPNVVLYRPAICAVVQGAKRTTFGDLRLELGAGQAAFVGISAPGLGRVIQASPTEPYLGIVIELDMATLREVLEELDVPEPPEEPVRAGIFQIDFEGPLADCAARMIRLLETPRAIPTLAPGIMREICYWLLTGPYGGEVCRVARLGGAARAIVDSIRVLRDRFAEPVRVEELARAANMSPSVFHLRFKALTATSPLQYQKQLRLHEARRLLIASETNVETVAFRVGYESPSQFNREYSRTFGRSPRRDAVAMRALAR